MKLRRRVRTRFSIFLLLATGVFTLPIIEAAIRSGAIPPTITVSDVVGANPGTVYTAAGQATRIVNVTWNAGTDYAYCEIYYTVNGANQSELGRGHDGTKPFTVTAGSAYEIWMVVYPGGGQFTVVTKLNVVAKQGDQPPPPPPPPASGGIGTGVGDPLAKKKDGGALSMLAINNVRVDPGPRHVIIRFNGPPNQMPYVAIGRGPAVKGADGQLVFGENLVGGGFIGLGTVTEAEKARGEYMFASAHGTTFTEDGLEPGRTYYYIITVPGNGRSYQDTGSFVMRQLATDVTVVWERVLILDDSDDLSTGEIKMWFWANFGQPGAKFSSYSNGDADSGRAYDINKPVVIQNAPNFLSLSASGQDADDDFGNHQGVAGPDGNPLPLIGPNNATYADENVAKDTFDLTKYDDNAKVNFILNSMSGGSLQFVIYGRFEITRRTVVPGSSGNSENIGTNSSALGKDTGAINPPPRPQFIGTFGTTPANYQPMWVYAIKDDGDLLWYRKDSGEAAWQGPKKVGNGWAAGYKDAIPAGGNSIYLLSDDGKLFWYQHTGFNDGTLNWKARVQVGRGWGFAKIFSGGEGIIYAITQEGKLLWYRHNGYMTGAGLEAPGAWENAKEVGRGWGGFEQVFSAGGGVIYAITGDGRLRWYKHNGYLTGASLETPGAWEGPKEVGHGWSGFRQVVPAGAGVILAIQNDGKLRWYRHNGYLTGTGLATPGAWEGPKEVGTGWQGFKKVIALLPVASAPVVR